MIELCAGRGHLSPQRPAPARLRRVHPEVPSPAPGLAADSPGRRTDIAFDHGEFTQLDAARIADIAALMRAHGLNATVSSIHVNG